MTRTDFARWVILRNSNPLDEWERLTSLLLNNEETLIDEFSRMFQKLLVGLSVVFNELDSKAKLELRQFVVENFDHHFRTYDLLRAKL